MEWEQVEHLVELQIGYWQAVGKHSWAEAIERCLAEAQRSRAMRDVAIELRQRLTEAEETSTEDEP